MGGGGTHTSTQTCKYVYFCHHVNTFTVNKGTFETPELLEMIKQSPFVII